MECDGPKPGGADAGAAATRRLRPGERIIDGRLHYSAAWLGATEDGEEWFPLAALSPRAGLRGREERAERTSRVVETLTGRRPAPRDSSADD